MYYKCYIHVIPGLPESLLPCCKSRRSHTADDATYRLGTHALAVPNCINNPKRTTHHHTPLRRTVQAKDCELVAAREASTAAALLSARQAAERDSQLAELREALRVARRETGLMAASFKVMVQVRQRSRCSVFAVLIAVPAAALRAVLLKDMVQVRRGRRLASTQRRELLLSIVACSGALRDVVFAAMLQLQRRRCTGCCKG